MAYSYLLFSLIQCNAQYVSQLCRHFKEVLSDFGPHQTIQLFQFLSPFPPSTKVIKLILKNRLSGVMEDGCRWLLFLCAFGGVG
jgi:hypothetical protein